MAFQWLFDNANKISINKRAVVGQSITRNQTVRAVSRGNGLYKFTITMPNGMPWSSAASYIDAIDTADRFTKETVTINHAGYNSWIHNGTLSNSLQTWSVICISIPEWTISDRDTVEFSGPFVFMEARV